MNASMIEACPPVADEARSTVDVASYRAVHNAMRATNEQLVAGLASAPSLAPRRAAALAKWFEGYAAELRTHHRIEDDLIFPALARRSTEFAALRVSLDSDHHRLHVMLDELCSVLARWADCPEPHVAGNYRNEALGRAVELRDLLAVHLDVEDEQVIPLVRKHFSADEFEGLEKAAGRALTLKQAFWTVPWIVATFEPAVLEKVWADAPAMLKLIHSVSRRPYARLTATAFGAAS